MEGKLKGAKGFSLLELLIVVSVILIIATIAIPSFLKSRQSANESSAVANLRTVGNAQATYSISSGGQYVAIPVLITQGLLDDRFTTGLISGYNLTLTTSGFEYTAVASPLSPNSGRFGFYLVSDGVVRYSTISALAPTGRAGTPVN